MPRDQNNARCHRIWHTIITLAGYVFKGTMLQQTLNLSMPRTHEHRSRGPGRRLMLDDVCERFYAACECMQQGKPQREIPIAYKESERLSYRKYGDALGYCQNILPQSEIHRSEYEEQ